MKSVIVLAGGLGSRFGGLKQMQSVTADGRCLIDFTLQDAKRAGFDNAVIVLRKETLPQFDKKVGKRLRKIMPIRYVLQDMPTFCPTRAKPLGTAHAILCCKNVVDCPFAVVNADDYYGKNAFFPLSEHLQKATGNNYAMMGYKLADTLCPNGVVNRAVCLCKNGYLQRVQEVTGICAHCIGTCFNQTLSSDSVVSMNLWAFTCDFFEHLQKQFDNFVATANLQRDELYVAQAVNVALTQGASVRVFTTTDKWYGITYKQDLQLLQKTGIFD